MIKNLNKFTQQEENSCLLKRTTKRKKSLAISVQVKVVKLVYTLDKVIEKTKHFYITFIYLFI